MVKKEICNKEILKEWLYPFMTSEFKGINDIRRNAMFDSIDYRSYCKMLCRIHMLERKSIWMIIRELLIELVKEKRVMSQDENYKYFKLA